MNTHQLEYLIAIEECGSLLGAARKLGLSQPALSKSVLQLEEEIGLKLFFRYNKKLHPTPAGRRYLETAREVLQIMDRTARSIANAENQKHTELRLGISPHRGASLIADIYPDFISMFPDVELKLQEGYANPLKQSLLKDTADLCITSGFNQAGLRSIPLRREEILLAVPSYYNAPLNLDPEAQSTALPVKEETVSLSDYSNSVFIMPDQDSSLYETIRPLFPEAGFEPQTAFASSNVILMQRLICTGMGIGLLPYHYTLHEPRLHCLHLQHPIYLQLALFLKEDHVLTDAEQYLLYLILLHQLKAEPDEPCNRIVWTRETLEIVRRFDPACAEGLKLTENL